MIVKYYKNVNGKVCKVKVARTIGVWAIIARPKRAIIRLQDLYETIEEAQAAQIVAVELESLS